MSNFRKNYSDIYDKNVTKIYRFVLLKVKSTEIAEDLTSEVFMRGWQAYKTKQDKIENVQAFLYQIARNLLADHYRQETRAQFVSVDYAPPLPDQKQDIEAMSFVKSDMEQVKAALNKINDDYRDVIIWYYMDELKVPEIAKILNKSEPTVRVLIHRALQSLKAELKVISNL
ncbi:MAG: RNA polymerase sigma factor [Candidatus Komeilibacteria bacterium]